MKAKPLIVGQAPGPNTDPGVPLSGRCGARLAALCGLDVAGFLDRFDRVNLIAKFPGKAAGKGDRFPIDAARRKAIDLLLFGEMRRDVVLLGGNVARAFGFPAGVEPFRANYVDGNPAMTLFFCPHPSGVSHFWNRPDNVEAARRFWTALASG